MMHFSKDGPVNKHLQLCTIQNLVVLGVLNQIPVKFLSRHFKCNKYLGFLI